MRAVDTNILVRLFVRDDARQADAARAFVERGAWISHLVLVETIWVLASFHELEAPRLADVIGELLDHESIVIQDADVVVRALAQFREHPRLGFSDCLILEIARKAGHLPLGTFDRELAKIEGAERLKEKS
jgi:predicted nucleic-acid-binding protein